MLSQLFRQSILRRALQPVWEGLADGRWNESQLAALQSRFEKLRPLDSYPLSLRGENVILLGQTMDRLRAGRYTVREICSDWISPLERVDWFNKLVGGRLSRIIPDGWFYQNHLVCSRGLLEYSLPLVDLQRGCINFKAVKAREDVLTRLEQSRSPYAFIGRILLPAYGSDARRFAHAQTTMDLAAVACALGRYRLAHGQYPEALDALAPQWIARLPHDVINRQPLKYRRTEDGQFVLYSVGWDEIDDAAKVVHKRSSWSIDTANGDWVWRYPAK